MGDTYAPGAASLMYGASIRGVSSSRSQCHTTCPCCSGHQPCMSQLRGCNAHSKRTEAVDEEDEQAAVQLGAPHRCQQSAILLISHGCPLRCSTPTPVSCCLKSCSDGLHAYAPATTRKLGGVSPKRFAAVTNFKPSAACEVCSSLLLHVFDEQRHFVTSATKRVRPGGQALEHKYKVLCAERRHDRYLFLISLLYCAGMLPLWSR